MDEGSAKRDGIWLGQIGGIIVVLAIIFWFIQMRQAPLSLLKRRDCERAYADAHSAAESALVDRRHPLLGGSQVDTLTCGGLRRSGWLGR
jgi:hypothetical protein